MTQPKGKAGEGIPWPEQRTAIGFRMTPEQIVERSLATLRAKIDAAFRDTPPPTGGEQDGDD